MSIGSFVVSLSVFLIDNVFSVCFTCILRWFSAQIKYYYYSDLLRIWKVQMSQRTCRTGLSA